MTVRDLTAWAEAVHSRSISSVELTTYYLDRIESYDPMLCSYITVCSEEAVRAARAADEQLASGDSSGVLTGVPMAIKDIIDTNEVRTTAGSRVLGNFVPSRDATVWRRLKEAGAILLGKHNLHEFAYGTTTENPHYGATHNPWNVACIAGGSSGGSAAAVAADLTPASIGTDTGGSIRIPAACTGIYGLKPTFGRVSAYGVTPLAFSLDHVGPLTRSVRDAALLMNLIAEYDDLDPNSVDRPAEDFASLLGESLRGFRIAVEERFFLTDVHGQIAARVFEAVRVLQEASADLCQVDIPGLEDIPETQNVVISSEALAFHEPWLKESSALYGEDVRTRLAVGRRYSGVDYANAHKRRLAFKRDLLEVFKEIDILVVPTLAYATPAIGDPCLVLTRLTNPFNLSGFPAISVPCGFSDKGMPVGVQLVARPFAEARLLQVAAVLEQAYPYAMPPLFT